MTENKTRKLRVYGTSGHNYKETPTIMLKGQWLKEFGFETGQFYEVLCESSSEFKTNAMSLPLSIL